MKARGIIDTVITNARKRGQQMATRARSWLIPGDGAASPAEALQQQLQGARTALEEARAEVERATERFDSAGDTASVEASTGELAEARAGEQLAAEHVARAERAIARNEAAKNAARRAKLEQRKAELEASVEQSRIDARARPLDDEEFRLLAAIVEVRSKRVQLKRSDCETLGELVRTFEELGLDSSAVEMSLSRTLAEPTHSHVVLQRLEALANTFGRDDARRMIASELSYAVVAPRVTVASHRQAAE